MNSPSDRPSPSSMLPERVARLEVTCERILDELRELRSEMRDLRRTASSDFRILFSANIAEALGLASVMANGVGWI